MRRQQTRAGVEPVRAQEDTARKRNSACPRRPSVEFERRSQKFFDGFNGRLVCGGVVCHLGPPFHTRIGQRKGNLGLRVQDHAIFALFHKAVAPGLRLREPERLLEEKGVVAVVRVGIFGKARVDARAALMDARFEKRMRGFEKLARIGMREMADLRKFARQSDERMEQRSKEIDHKINALIDAQQRTEASLRAFLDNRRTRNGQNGRRGK